MKGGKFKDRSGNWQALTAIARSTAWENSRFPTTNLFALPANKAASLTRFARSALLGITEEFISNNHEIEVVYNMNKEIQNLNQISLNFRTYS